MKANYYLTSSFGLQNSVIKNAWSLIAKINPNGKALVQKNKKSSQEDNVVKGFLKCKLYKTYHVNGVQNHFNLNQILT